MHPRKRRRPQSEHPPSRRNGFSLIELLMVISIIALLLSILMPALGRAREQAKSTVCLAHIRGISQSTVMYLDNDGQNVLRWYIVPVLQAYGSVGVRTPWVFGGFKAPIPNAHRFFSGTPDSSLYPAEARPLNRYVDATAQGSVQLNVYKCPGDRTFETAIIGQTGPPPIEEDVYASWEANGNSFSLNTRFMQGYTQPTGVYNHTAQANIFARRIAPHMIGGKASRFATWVEQGFYSATYMSRETLAASTANPQKNGWHREFSKWSIGFADGHARYGYFDTRLSIGPDWTIWQPK